MNAEHIAWTINNSSKNVLSDVTASEVEEAMAKYIASKGEEYTLKFGLRTRKWIDSEDREALAQIILSSRRTS